MSDIDTAAFRNPAKLSLWLREGLRAVVLPRVDPKHRAAYEAQFDVSSRNLEVTLENLARLFSSHPLKALPILRAVADWHRRYHGTQDAVETRDRLLVYTEHDHAIPFRPEDDIVYAYMVAQLAYVATELSEVISRKQMWSVTGGFVDMNRSSQEAFSRIPTMTPRFLEHDRLTLSVVQDVDDPVNCCPSLHIAYSIYLDNVAQFTIRPNRKKREVFDAIRFSTLRMVNSVLYTKQHSLIDVAFGILCAKIAFEKRFDHPFDDFLGTFDALAREHPIRYDVIASYYREAAARYSLRGNLADVLGDMLRDHGFVAVPAGADHKRRYFDTRTKSVVIA